jgi:hypothetical protein
MMISVESQQIKRCEGIQFSLEFEVGGKIGSGIPGDPEYDLFCDFAQLQVRIGEDNFILIEKETDAIDCIGDDVMEKAKNVAVFEYIERKSSPHDYE